MLKKGDKVICIKSEGYYKCHMLKKYNIYTIRKVYDDHLNLDYNTIYVEESDYTWRYYQFIKLSEYRKNKIKQINASR